MTSKVAGAPGAHARVARNDLKEYLRGRLARLVNEQMEMQESLLTAPAHRIPMLCEMLERHARRMSDLAALLAQLDSREGKK